MKQGYSLKTLFFLTYFFLTSTNGEAVSAFAQDKGYTIKKKFSASQDDILVQRPNSIGSFQGYIFSKPSTSANTEIQSDTQETDLDKQYIQQQKDARFLRRSLYQRHLQRGSRSSHKDSSSSKYFDTIVYVCVSVLIFMSMVCVGLRHYIGIPQDPYPELTERKKVMKDMTEKEKRSVLEYIFFKQQQKEVNKKDEVADLETDSNNSSSSNATDIPDETETTNQSSKKQRVLSEDHVEKSCILGSIRKEGNSEASVDTESTRSLNVADSKEEDVDLDEVVCSICLDSFEADSDGVLYAPNCSHRFHKECIMEWFLSQSSNLTCPDCRSQMFTVDEFRAAAEALNGTTKQDGEDVAWLRKNCIICWCKE